MTRRLIDIFPKLRLTAAMWIITVLAVTFSACSDKEEILADDYQEASRIEIRPNVGRQDIELTETRSVGPFDKWSNNPSLWQNANFYTFALQTQSPVQGSVTDFTQVSDVMDNQLMRIQNAQGSVKFMENGKEVHRYYSYWRNRRYKFFTYFIDDAETDGKLKNLVRKKDEITAEVTINGRQDLMHGFAYHTDQELKQLVDKMNKNEEETKVFTNANEGRDYLYSAIAANRGIQPQFHLKHLLSRFDIYVQGAINDKLEGNDRYSFLQCFIDTLFIESRNHGTLVIANDKWNDGTTYNEAFENRELVKWNKSRVTFLPTIIDNHKVNSQEPLKNVDFERLWQEMVDSSLVDPTNIHYHQVTSTTPTQLCENMLLPSGYDTIYVRLAYKYMFYNYSNTYNRWKVNIDQTRKDGSFGDRNSHSIVLPNGAPFLPGRKYVINIKIYGPTQVSVDVINSDSWKPGGQEDINTDDGDIIVK